MYKKYILSGYDEFNSINVANYYELDHQNTTFYTETTDTFCVLFNNFDKIVIPKKDYIDTKYFSVNDPIGNNAYQINDIKKSIRLWFESRNITEFDINSLEQEYIKDHIYTFIFRTLSKQILENTINWITPKQKDYLEISEKLKLINKPIITVHGRNLPKHPNRNSLLLKYIKNIIKKGGFVINTTVNPPNLRFPSDSYLEVATNQFSYSEQISYFLNSNCVIAIGNGSGINHHLATQSNICTFAYKGESWINNPHRDDLKHNNKTVIESRLTRKDVATLYTEYEDLSVLDECLRLPKPQIKSFFDINKVIEIDS